jgi:hypothetical protein
MNKEPSAECASFFEHFTTQERALNCPTCLTFQVQCLGNYHPKIQQPAPGNYFKSYEFIESFPSHFSYLYFIFAFDEFLLM